jgi:hypothetical protein
MPHPSLSLIVHTSPLSDINRLLPLIHLRKLLLLPPPLLLLPRLKLSTTTATAVFL